MEGAALKVLVGVLGALLSLSVALIGIILRQHEKSDEEHRARLEKEIERMRQRIHDYGGMIVDLQAKYRLTKAEKGE